MMIATNLSTAAREALVTFCAENLKDGLDAELYANGFIEQADFSDGAHFEIRAFDSATGAPVTISFNGSADLVWEEIDDTEE